MNTDINERSRNKPGYGRFGGRFATFVEADLRSAVYDFDAHDFRNIWTGHLERVFPIFTAKAAVHAKVDVVFAGNTGSFRLSQEEM